MTGRTTGVSLVWRARGVNKRAAIPRGRGVDIGDRPGENPADMKEIGTQIATLFLT